MGVRLNRKVAVPDLDTETYFQCLSLNARGRGMMRETLVNCRKGQYAWGHVYFFREDTTRRVIAWALVYRTWVHYTDYPYHAHFWTRASHRKLGYGSRLMQAILEDYRQNITVMGHNERAYQFFQKFESRKYVRVVKW